FSALEAPMTSPSSWYAAAHNWRMRAAEALADDMKEAEPKAIMLRIAADYEKLAEWAEKKLSTLVGQETGCEQVAAATHAVIICLSDTASPRPGQRVCWHVPSSLPATLED